VGHLLHSSILVPYHGWLAPEKPCLIQKIIFFLFCLVIFLKDELGIVLHLRDISSMICLVIIMISLLLATTGELATGLIIKTMDMSRMMNRGIQ
jgi:hypothetical protein